MTGTAAVLLVLLLLRAVLTADPYYDTFAYHLPFAGRLAGLCPETCYRMGDYLEAVHAGFPNLFHRLQGLVWRLTGRAQAVDLLSAGALVLFCLFLRRCFRVPAAWTFCALLAVPLIQIHATSTYIDLPVNLAAAAAILALMALVRAPESVGWAKLAGLGACLVFAAGSKPQMLGVAAPVAALFAALAIAAFASGRRFGPFVPGRLAGWIGLAVLLLLIGGGMIAKPVANAIAYGNPFYPLRVAVAGLVLEGSIDAFPTAADSLAEAWQRVPSPVRWLGSVLEVGAYDFREAPWTFDQGYCASALEWRHCWRPATGSFRMGGYFVPYVLGLVAFLGWRLASLPYRDRRILGTTFVAATLLAALLPRSHELRYYLFWMIVLVALCLVAAFAPPERNRAADGASRLLGTGILVALASVLLLTQARYVTPIGSNVDALLTALRVRESVATIPDAASACVDPAWQPFTFLFAPVFHPGRSYSVLDGHIGPCSVIVPPPPGAGGSS